MAVRHKTWKEAIIGPVAISEAIRKWYQGFFVGCLIWTKSDPLTMVPVLGGFIAVHWVIAPLIERVEKRGTRRVK